MKKIFALLVLFLYCISLASCEFITKNEVRTTITKVEWSLTLESSNFSILSNFLMPIEKNFGQNSVSLSGAEIIKVSGDSYMIDFSTKSGLLQEDIFFKKIDDVLYTIEKTNEGYVGYGESNPELNSIKSLNDIFLLWFGLDCNAIYNSLVYIEECKTYRGIIGMYEKQLGQIEVECVDGNIEKMRLYLFDRDLNEPTFGLLTFYNFGTTVVEIPEFTFAN